jgi:hypothetical protein
MGSCRSVNYEYRPLESDHIRILHLSPGSGQEPLLCEIEHAELAKKPSYEALSYVWGTGTASYRATVGSDKLLHIRPSLYNALRDLRHAEESRALWVDAICINQSNVDEKSQQVALMCKIYREAASVVTYIGEEEEDISQGLALAYEIQDYVQSHLHEDPDGRLLLTDEDEELCRLGFPPRYHPKWRALRYLMKLPWATRMWIVQESVLNREMIMMYGRTVIPWGLLPDITQFGMVGRAPILAFVESQDQLQAAMTGSLSSREQSGATRMFAFSNIRKLILENQGKLPLLRLLTHCRRLDSTDTRDQVYALLGIAADKDQIGMDPNYSIPVEEAYITTAIRILQTNPHLDLLSAVRAKTSLKLPSWVPDWSPSTDLEHIAIPLSDIPLDRGIYHASAETTSRVTFDRLRLTVRGGFIDEISYTSEKLIEKLVINDSTPDPRGKVAWLRERLSEVKNLQIYGTEDGAVDAFWRTIIANRTHEFKKATQEYRGRFETWLKVREKLAEILSGRSEEDVGLPSMSEFDECREFQTSITTSLYMTLSNTQKGYICLTPSNACIGDHICILEGGRMPFVVRQNGNDFDFIGEAYVHGLMKGEAFQLKDFKIKDITLV